jgi:hypothetical protein
MADRRSSGRAVAWGADQVCRGHQWVSIYVQAVEKLEGMPMTHGKEDGNTLLHFASRVGNMLLIRELLRQGEDINARNKVGQTALDIAEQYQKSEAVLELSRHGAQR